MTEVKKPESQVAMAKLVRVVCFFHQKL